MKKLFALVLSLALALAIAVPVMGAGWTQLEGNIDSFDEISLKIVGLEYSANTSFLGSIFAPLTTFAPVVAGSGLHFMVELDVPKEAKLSADAKALIANKGFVMEIVPTNMKLGEPTYYVDTVKEATLTGATADEDGVVFTSTNVTDIADKTFSFELYSTVTKSGKDASVKAMMYFANADFDAGIMFIDNDSDGINEYRVASADGGFYIHNYNAAGTTLTNGMFFPVTGDPDKDATVDYDKGVQVIYDGTVYYFSTSVTNPDAFTTNGTDLVTEGTTYNAIKAVADGIFKFLGFDYEEANYMTTAHFEKFYGTIVEWSTNALVWPTGTVVVAPVTPSLPQTGDNASFIGFAMIAVAMVAAAVVTIKKVRA